MNQELRRLRKTQRFSYDDLVNLADGCTRECLFKYIAQRIPGQRKFAVQMKCLQMFQWDRSQQEGRNVEDDVFSIWVHEGYAKRFGQCYDEESTPKDIYDRIMSKEPVSTPAQR